MEIPLPFSDTFLMEPRKATCKSAPSAKAHEQGKQKVKKTNPRSQPPKSKPSPKARKHKVTSDHSVSEGDEDDNMPTTSTSKKQSRKKCQHHHKSFSSVEEVDEVNSDESKVEVIESGHSDDHESDEVHIKREMVLITSVNVTGWSAGTPPC